jgi:hypothetical protein
VLWTPRANEPDVVEPAKCSDPRKVSCCVL